MQLFTGQHAGRKLTSTQAFTELEGQLPIRRCLARLNSQALAHVLEHFFTAAEREAVAAVAAAR